MLNAAHVVTSIVRNLAQEILGRVATEAVWTPIHGNLGPGCLVRFGYGWAAETFVQTMNADPRMVAALRPGIYGGAQVAWVGEGGK